MASTLTGIVAIVLASIACWVAKSHYNEIIKSYQDILKEKDDNYWEMVNRRETFTTHSEEDCKRQIGHFTALVSAYDEQIKSLLHTDVKSIQLREESHQKVLSIYQSRVEKQSEHMDAKMIQCLQYWQSLQRELSACNSSQIGLRYKNRQFRERESVKEKQTNVTQKRLKQCELEQEQSTSYSYSNLIVLTIAILSMMAIVNKGKTPFKENIRDFSPKGQSQIQKFSETLAEVEKQRQVEKEQLEKELARAKIELAAADSKIDTIDKDKEKLEIESEKQKKKLTDEKENALKFGKEQAMEKKKLEQQFHTLQKEKSKLVCETDRLRKEVQTCQQHALKTEEKLAAQKQDNQDLKKHEKVLETKIKRQGRSIHKRDEQNDRLGEVLRTQEIRIAKQNEKDLTRKDELKQKNEEIKQIKSELLKQKKSLEKKEQEMFQLQEKHALFTKDYAEFEAAVLQKDIELDKEVEKRQRVHEMLSCKEDQIKRLERQIQEMSHQSSHRGASKHKLLPSEMNADQIKQQLRQEFEVKYNRHETKTHDKITSLTETIGQLQTDIREQSIELSQAQSLNKRLQELLDYSHAQSRRKKVKEANDRTYRPYRLQLDLSLSPPHSLQ